MSIDSLFHKSCSAFIVLIFCCSPCLVPAHAEPIAFGEIKAHGEVHISSSTGKWSSLHDIYPLLNYTRLRTGQGVAGVTTREGSRLDLSNSTEAEIEAAAGIYTVKLSEGTFAFSVVPDSSVRIITKEADIIVARQAVGSFSLVAGKGAPSYSTVQGLVIRSNKGTLVQSMVGSIQVNGKNLQARIIDSGESLFAAAEGTQSEGTGVALREEKNVLLKQALILGAFFTTGTIIAIDTFRGHGFKSPSGF